MRRLQDAQHKKRFQQCTKGECAEWDEGGLEGGYGRFPPQGRCVDETRCGNLHEFRVSGFLFAASHSAEFNNALMHAK